MFNGATYFTDFLLRLVDFMRRSGHVCKTEYCFRRLLSMSQLFSSYVSYCYNGLNAAHDVIIHTKVQVSTGQVTYDHLNFYRVITGLLDSTKPTQLIDRIHTARCVVSCIKLHRMTKSSVVRLIVYRCTFPSSALKPFPLTGSGVAASELPATR